MAHTDGNDGTTRGRRRARRWPALVGGALLVIPGVALNAAPASASVPTELFVGDSTVIEGSGGANSVAHFALRLSAPAATDAYVWFHTVDGSAVARSKATPDGDFALKAAGKTKVKIPAGKVDGDIGVVVYGDTSEEGNETFTVSIDYVTTTPTGSPDPSFAVARTPGTGTIVDDDPTAGSAGISIGDAAVPEGNPTAKGKAKLNVRLSEPMPTAEYVYFHTVSSSALGGHDFVAKTTASKVKIPAGKLVATITTNTLPDNLEEGNESYSVVIDKVTTTIGGAQDLAVTIVDGTGDVVILDDDGASSVPGPPTGLSGNYAYPFNGTIDLHWTAPASDGGRSVTSYTVERNLNFGGSWDEVGTVATTNGTFPCGNAFDYCAFRVVAHNSVGAGSPSAQYGYFFNCDPNDIQCWI